jgi:hypothetical protein
MKTKMDDQAELFVLTLARKKQDNGINVGCGVIQH